MVNVKIVECLFQKKQTDSNSGARMASQTADNAQVRSWYLKNNDSGQRKFCGNCSCMSKTANEDMQAM